MSDITITREPGRPCASFETESMPDNRRGRTANGCRESDNFVVSEKAGNAAGEKEVTCGSTL